LYGLLAGEVTRKSLLGFLPEPFIGSSGTELIPVSVALNDYVRSITPAGPSLAPIYSWDEASRVKCLAQGHKETECDWELQTTNYVMVN
jgi:hypothetical protein